MNLTQTLITALLTLGCSAKSSNNRPANESSEGSPQETEVLDSLSRGGFYLSAGSIPAPKLSQKSKNHRLVLEILEMGSDLPALGATVIIFKVGSTEGTTSSDGQMTRETKGTILGTVTSKSTNVFTLLVPVSTQAYAIQVTNADNTASFNSFWATEAGQALDVSFPVRFGGGWEQSSPPIPSEPQSCIALCDCKDQDLAKFVKAAQGQKTLTASLNDCSYLKSAEYKLNGCYSNPGAQAASAMLSFVKLSSTGVGGEHCNISPIPAEWVH